MFVAQVRETYYRGGSLHHGTYVPARYADTRAELQVWWEGLRQDEAGYVIPDRPVGICAAADRVLWDIFDVYEVASVPKDWDLRSSAQFLACQLADILEEVPGLVRPPIDEHLTPERVKAIRQATLHARDWIRGLKESLRGGEGYIDEIQPRMKRTVAWLQSLGFQTTDSGDGVTNVEAGMEGALDFPHVMMSVPPPLRLIQESERLLETCRLVGIQGFKIEASYDPDDSSCILMLTGVTDESLPGSL